jgi:hypothetical protein
MNTVVFSYGRFNPPTKGHQHLVNFASNLAKEQNADYVLYLSQTHKAPDNPLPWDLKRRVCQQAFPNVYISNDGTARTPFQALESLCHFYDKVIMVSGKDQIELFSEKMGDYAKEWGAEFEAISAGERTPNTNNIEGISSTRMRRYAAAGDISSFYAYLPDTIDPATGKMLFEQTQYGIVKR